RRSSDLGVIMFLIGASSMIIHILTVAGIPAAITNSILSITDNKIIIILIILSILIFVGTFMDVAPAVLIFTPIFLPIVQSFGMDVVHLDRKSTRLNSSHVSISYAVFCLKKKN